MITRLWRGWTAREDAEPDPAAVRVGDHGSAGRSAAFISYSHVDRAFALRLQGALEADGEQIWMDERDIAGGSAWRHELQLAIESADAFVFVVSPASVASQVCSEELTYAAGLNKRILPVRLAAVDASALPREVSQQQLIPARDPFTADFEVSLKLLLVALRSDPEWVREHTELGRRGLQWARHGRDHSFLLAGTELNAAERWRRAAPGMSPAPTVLHNEYIDSSRHRATQRLRRTRSVLVVGVIGSLALAGVALWQRSDAIERQHTDESLQLAATAEATLQANPEHSTLLALQALRISITPQAVAALREAVPQNLEEADIAAGGTVRSAVFSPSGAEVLTADSDGTARIWSVATRHVVETIVEPHRWPILDAAFSPRGDEVATVSADGMARVWSTNTDRRLGPVLEPGEGALESVGFSPDGSRLVTASSDGIACIWNLETGGPPLRLIADRGATLFSAAFSPNGGEVVTASNDGTAEVWNSETGARIRRIGVEKGPGLYDATFDPSGYAIVTAGADGVARIWSVRTGVQFRQFDEPAGGQLHSAVFSPNGGEILTASNDGTARLWGVVAGTTLLTFAGHTNRVLSAGFNAEGNSVVTASADGTARLWSAIPVSQIAAFFEPRFAATHADLSPDAADLVVTGADGSVRLWRREDGAAFVPLSGGGVSSAAFGSDGSEILTTGDDGVARVLSTVPGVPVRPVSTPEKGGLRGGAFGSGNRIVVTFGADGWTRVWRVYALGHAPTQVSPAFHDPGRVLPLSASFSPDGARVAVASNDGVARIWTIGSDAAPRLLIEPGQSLLSDAEFSPDGREIVTASNDGTARIWRLATAKEVGHVTEPGRAELTGASFSPDGSEILTSSRDGTARVWSATTGRQLTVLSEPGGAQLYSAHFSRDGRDVVTASADGATRIWSLRLAGSLDSLERIAERSTAWDLSPAERAADLAGA